MRSRGKLQSTFLMSLNVPFEVVNSVLLIACGARCCFVLHHGFKKIIIIGAADINEIRRLKHIGSLTRHYNDENISNSFLSHRIRF